MDTITDNLLKVLVADDEAAIRSFLGAVLEERGDCDFQFASDGEEAFRKIATYQPDLLITDLSMPGMGGEELADRVIQIQPDLTILVETGNATLESAVRLMREGVVDLITKPFRIEDLRGRLDRAFEKSRSRRSTRFVDAIVNSLMTALAAKDRYLKTHSENVSILSRLLGRDFGLSARELECLEWGALIHDVGKIGISETVLHKPGKLTDEEFAEMKLHPTYSAQIIRPLALFKGGEATVKAVYHHHERIDGTGYPAGIAGKEIPSLAKIISVCDVFDALSSDRPYRRALNGEQIRKIIQDAGGTHLDPELVSIFLQNIETYKNDVLVYHRDKEQE